MTVTDEQLVTEHVCRTVAHVKVSKRKDCTLCFMLQKED